MNAVELLDIVSTGETTKVQFKEELPHRDSVAQEIVAMSNSLGGVILLGVKDVTGELVGLSAGQIEEYDRIVSQVADNIRPIVYITTEVIKVDVCNSIKNILVVHIQDELYEVFLRFDDKPMINGSEAIIQSVQKYCYNGEFNIAYGEPEKFERIYHQQNVPFLSVEEPRYWLVDKSVQNKTKEDFPEQEGQNKKDNDDDKKEEPVSIDNKENSRTFKSINVSGKIPVEQWTNLFSSFVIPLKNNNLEIEVSFKAKTNSLNPLDESSQVYKIVKESAKQLGLDLEEGQ